MFAVGMDDNIETVRKIVDYAIAINIETIQICPLPLPEPAAYGEIQGRLLRHESRY